MSVYTDSVYTHAGIFDTGSIRRQRQPALLTAFGQARNEARGMRRSGRAGLNSPKPR